MTETTQLFVDTANAALFDHLYQRFTGMATRFADLAYGMKQMIMRRALASEIAVLALALDRLTEHERRTRDFTLNSLRDAMREVIACFPVYRTYLTGSADRATQGDRPRSRPQSAKRGGGVPTSIRRCSPSSAARCCWKSRPIRPKPSGWIGSASQ